ncbi:MAG: tryptophan synthase subunit alpha [Hydrogenibacillus sp.]|nr:tryptophan synthase subunit alpha [Hydrogenibacillus sp.]
MGHERIVRAFQTAKTDPAFIPFVMAGDPDLPTTARVVRALADGGAALIEIGVPYSDPLADGPVLQEAALRALRAGTTPKDVLELVQSVRRTVDIPIVLLLYVNAVLQYGSEAFVREAALVGVDGLIVPDLPIEESESLLTLTKAHDVALVPLVAPTSTGRLGRILADREGFVYVVSSLGVTGKRDALDPSLGALIRTVRSETALPIAVGFGLSRREQLVMLRGIADGAIVGSALVDHLARGGTVEAWLEEMIG